MRTCNLRYAQVLVLTCALLSSAVAGEPTVEGRALWIPAWELTDPAAVRSAVIQAAEYRFNAVFVQVRYRGDALYIPHRYTSYYANPEPRSIYIKNQPGDFDPLALAVEEGHAWGLSVHAWVTCFEVTGGFAPKDENHVVNRHPEWVSCDRWGNRMDVGHRAWLDPGIPEVRDYTASVLLDIVSNYEVDGLHLDYVRYEGPEMGFAPIAVSEYWVRTGLDANQKDEQWRAWRRDNVTEFLSRVQREVREINPDIIVSAAVFSDREVEAYSYVCQDWGRWLAEGLVDLVAPMSYSLNGNVIARQTTDAVLHAGGALVYTGIALRNFSDGSAVLDPAVVRSHIEAVRASGADGVAIFSYTDLKEMILARMTPDDLFTDPAEEPVLENW
jgi:uncharacterized lipoprotein YddW (UPF0748 family)